MDGVHPEAGAWFNAVCTTDQWEFVRLCDVRSESRPEWFKRRDGLHALVKPNHRHGDSVSRCAHEKIAADLAFLCGFNVPPVQLWDRAANGLCSLSAAAFKSPTAWPLAHALQPFGHEELISAGRQFEWSRAFHMWIQDQDRKAAHVLVDDDAPEGEIRLAFVDHAFSLSKPWEEGSEDHGLEAMEAVSAEPYVSMTTPDPAARADAVRAIRSVPKRDVAEVVHRVPHNFLSEPRKELIVRTLLERRLALEDLIDRASWGT